MKFVKISWERYEKDCLRLAKKLQKKRINKIVAISRGGLVVARILSDLLSVPISHITIVSYKNLQQQKKPILKEVPAKKITGKRILIVDEVCDSGKTFIRALSYFKKLDYHKLYTASLYVKSGAQPRPNFYGDTIDAWIIFPYEVKETYQAFLKLYQTKKQAIKKLLEVGFENWELKNI